MNKVRLRMPNIWQSKLIKEKKGIPRGTGTLFANRALFEIEHDQLPGLHFFVVVGSKSLQHWPLSITAASQSCSAVAKKRPKLQGRMRPSYQVICVISEQFLQSLVAISHALRFDLIKV